MPRLENERHELFAQAVAKGKTYREAYKLAGYKAEAEHTIDVSASRLLSFDVVKNRVAEIQERASRRVEVTVESLSNKLEEIRRQALADQQHGAAVSAVMGMGKLHGLLIDKAENKNMAIEVKIDRELAKVL